MTSKSSSGSQFFSDISAIFIIHLKFLRLNLPLPWCPLLTLLFLSVLLVPLCLTLVTFFVSQLLTPKNPVRHEPDSQWNKPACWSLTLRGTPCPVGINGHSQRNTPRCQQRVNHWSCKDLPTDNSTIQCNGQWPWSAKCAFPDYLNRTPHTMGIPTCP